MVMGMPLHQAYCSVPYSGDGLIPAHYALTDNFAVPIVEIRCTSVWEHLEHEDSIGPVYM